MNDLSERLSRLERQSMRHNQAVNRLLEISIMCYGILRRYVLGLFVIRLTKTRFEDYAAGFKKRLEIFRNSIRSGNLLLEGDYEKTADEFAQGLDEATTIKWPVSNQDQAAA